MQHDSRLPRTVRVLGGGASAFTRPLLTEFGSKVSPSTAVPSHNVRKFAAAAVGEVVTSVMRSSQSSAESAGSSPDAGKSVIQSVLRPLGALLMIRGEFTDAGLAGDKSTTGKATKVSTTSLTAGDAFSSSNRQFGPGAAAQTPRQDNSRFLMEPEMDTAVQEALFSSSEVSDAVAFGIRTSAASAVGAAAHSYWAEGGPIRIRSCRAPNGTDIAMDAQWVHGELGRPSLLASPAALLLQSELEAGSDAQLGIVQQRQLQQAVARMRDESFPMDQGAQMESVGAAIVGSFNADDLAVANSTRTGMTKTGQKHVSARMRNRARRKGKQAQTEVRVQQDASNAAFSLDLGLQLDGSDSEPGCNCWFPFAGVVQVLLLELTSNPRWESRHGAACGLRSILLSREKTLQSSLHMCSSSLRSIAQKLIEALILDRFGDFVLGRLVAPVREVVGQCIALCVSIGMGSSDESVPMLLKEVVAVLRILCSAGTTDVQFEEGDDISQCSWQPTHAAVRAFVYLTPILGSGKLAALSWWAEIAAVLRHALAIEPAETSITRFAKTDDIVRAASELGMFALQALSENGASVDVSSLLDSVLHRLRVHALVSEHAGESFMATIATSLTPTLKFFSSLFHFDSNLRYSSSNIELLCRFLAHWQDEARLAALDAVTTAVPRTTQDNTLEQVERLFSSLVSSTGRFVSLLSPSGGVWEGLVSLGTSMSPLWIGPASSMLSLLVEHGCKILPDWTNDLTENSWRIATFCQFGFALMARMSALAEIWDTLLRYVRTGSSIETVIALCLIAEGRKMWRPESIEMLWVENFLSDIDTSTRRDFSDAIERVEEKYDKIWNSIEESGIDPLRLLESEPTAEDAFRDPDIIEDGRQLALAVKFEELVKLLVENGFSQLEAETASSELVGEANQLTAAVSSTRRCFSNAEKVLRCATFAVTCIGSLEQIVALMADVLLDSDVCSDHWADFALHHALQVPGFAANWLGELIAWIKGDSQTANQNIILTRNFGFSDRVHRVTRGVVSAIQGSQDLNDFLSALVSLLSDLDDNRFSRTLEVLVCVVERSDVLSPASISGIVHGTFGRILSAARLDNSILNLCENIVLALVRSSTSCQWACEEMITVLFEALQGFSHGKSVYAREGIWNGLIVFEKTLLDPVVGDRVSSTPCRFDQREVGDISGLSLILIRPLLSISAMRSSSEESSMTTENRSSRCLALLLQRLCAIVSPTSTIPTHDVSGVQVDFVREYPLVVQLLFGQVSVATIPEEDGWFEMLRNYQQEGVMWLRFLRNFAMNGILADDMGIGKTVQSLCAVIDSRDRGAAGSNQGKADCKRKSSCLSLIVCPNTLVEHWLAEANRWFGPNETSSSERNQPTLTLRAYRGSPKQRQALLRTWTSRPAGLDGIVCSYDTLRKDIGSLSLIDFGYCILDEGHLLKNPDSQLAQAARQLSAKWRLILTGTPVQNNAAELWALFDWLMPGYLGSSRQWFRKHVARPIEVAAKAGDQCTSTERAAADRALSDLHRQVLPLVLRRTKDAVLSELPPKTIQDITCELSPIQREMYDVVDAQLKGSATSQAAPKPQVFSALETLRAICNHPRLAIESPLNGSSQQSDRRPTKQQRTQQPPAIESEGLKAELRRVFESAEMEQLENQSTKLTALRDVLMQCGIGVPGNPPSPTSVESKRRALIFAQRPAFLDIIEEDLKRLNGSISEEGSEIVWERLDGTVPAASRHSRAEQFNSDTSVDLLLLTTRVGGVGLTLTGADTVIFMDHDWNPMVDVQAMDRAHRLGAKRAVHVFRLITKDTLEERIMGLQRFKEHIANTIVTLENASTDTMDAAGVVDVLEDGATIQTIHDEESFLNEAQNGLDVESFMALLGP